MRLSHVRDILAVADHGGLRAAARQLGIAQSQITRSIRELESELEAELLDRHATGVRLTHAGEAFVRRARIMSSELRLAREEVQQLKGRNVGHVSVTMSTGSILSLLPSVTSAFRRRFPQANLRIRESLFQTIEGEFLSGAIDLYVGPFDADVRVPQFVVERLFDNHGVVFARIDHPLAHASSLRELVGEGWVRPAISGRTSESDFNLMFEQHGLPRPNIVLEAFSALVTLVTVANSDLFTILPRQWLGFSAVRTLIHPLELEDQMIRAPISIVRRQSAPLTPLAEAFCDMIRRAAINYTERSRIDCAVS